MEMQTKTKVVFSGPEDQSVEAFKTWILEIAERLTTEKNKIQLTEAEWHLHWRAYWNERFPRK